MDIFQFLLNGTYRGVSLGSEYSFVVEILGEYKIHDFDDDIKVILSGVIEAHFFKNELVNFFIKASNIDESCEVYVQERNNLICSKTGLDEIVTLFGRLTISWNIDSKLTNGKVVVLRTVGGATIEFLGGEDGFCINRIHLPQKDFMGGNRVIGSEDTEKGVVLGLK